MPMHGDGSAGLARAARIPVPTPPAALLLDRMWKAEATKFTTPRPRSRDRHLGSLCSVDGRQQLVRP